MNKKKLKLFFVILVFFMCFLVFKVEKTYGIYRDTLNTKVYLTILDPASSYTVTWHINDGSGNTTESHIAYNQQVGTLTVPTRTDYNFLGWYTANDRRIYSDEVITSNIDFYAHWQKIICKKVTNANDLHTETCVSGGCVASGVNLPVNSTITYGTIYGPSSPISGDAYDCDVNNDGTYDPQDQYGKYTERFYFLKEYEHNNSEKTATLIYYTSFDSTHGRIDSQHDTNIGSVAYDTALTWLPTSSTWTNPGLIGFDSNNGNITRFITLAEVEHVCGTIHRPFPAPNATVAAASYWNTCKQWYLFENSRFQSSDLGRAGIWMEIDNNQHYRIQTGSVALMSVAASSENMARPVIEIPFSAFEGYKNTEKHTVTFNTHGGTPQIEMRKVYTGDTIGTIETVTKEHFTFDGWYANYSNNQYSDPVNASTIVENDMTLHAKWVPVPTSTVTFDANGGTIDGESTFDLVVDTGNTIDPADIPEAHYIDHSFDKWYYDDELTEPFDIDEPITDDITLYAGWITGNSVARVNGIGYDTLAEAIAAVPTGKVKTTVTILKDITLTEAVEIPNTKYVELDIGNHTITGSFSTAGNMISNNGILDIISGNMIFNNSSQATRVIYNYSGAELNISGNCTLTNLGINTGNNTNDHPVIENTGGTINITGGTLNSNGLAATINNKSGTANISGGRVIGHNVTKAQAVYMEGGTVNISGNAYLENTSGTGETRGCVDNNGGTLRITGGTIVSKGHSAVIARKNGCTVIIGNDEGFIDITTPVMRGKVYGLDRSNGTVSVYDGIFESLDNTRAINGTIAKPNGIDFTDNTIDVDGVTYYSTYLLAPSITINFYEETNGTPIPVVVDNGGTFGSDLPTPSPKQGYLFAGWFIDGNPLKPVTSDTVVTGPFTVYAKWVQSVSDATFDDTMSIQINTTDTIEFEEDDIEDVTYLSSDTNVVTVDSDGTVHAVGVGTATITMTGVLSGDIETIDVTVTQIMRTVKFYDKDYDPNDLEHSTLLNTVQVVSGSTISNMPATPTDTNYVFKAWYIDGNSATPFTNATTVTGDLAVVANWKEKVTYATLTTTPNPFEIFVGNTGQITLTAKVQGDTVEDYTFASSNTTYATVNSTTGEVTGVAIGDTNIVVTGSLSGATVQVPISVDVLKYNVTFKDGNTVIKTVQVESGGTVGAEMPANQTKTNYIFNGWIYDDNNTLTPFTSATEVSGDIDVFVSWKEQINIATLPDDPISILMGSNKTILVTATGEGNLVEDYTLSSSNTNILEVNGKIVTGASVGSVTLTITGVDSHLSETITVNVINSHSVTFDPDNGDTSTIIQVEVGSSIADSGVSLPNDPTKNDVVFDNWYIYDETNETLTTTRLDTTATVTDDITYKAKWVANTYKAAVYGATTSYYTTLQAAFNAVPTSGVATEVKLLQDIINPTGQSKISSNRNIILNGGNYKVQCGASTTNQLIFNDGGTLRVISGTYLCDTDKLAVFQVSSGKTMYVDGGWIENTSTSSANARGAIYNDGGNIVITGGTLKSSAEQRGVVQNAKSGSSINMSGGTVIQTVVSTMGALHNGTSGSSITITGGTVTSVGNAIQNTNGSTLTVGTENGAYDETSPVIQGDLYGISSAVNYSIYDGIIKGKGETNKQQAVNDFTKITGTESGTTRITGTDGDYYTLYYEEPAPVQKYRINFYTNGGTGVASYIEYDLNEEITASDLPTPTKGIYTFDGWYTDDGLNTAFTSITPTTAGSLDCYASWSYASSSTPVNHVVTGDAMTYYFNNVSTWTAADAQIAANQDTNLSNDDHTTYASTMYTNFNNYSCSECEWPGGVQANQNKCDSPSSGTYCDKPKGYDTGINDELNVYLFENGAKSGSKLNGSTPGSYITVTNGVIYNMIPGNDYYWELGSDSNVYGVVSATKNGTHYRRTLNTSIRNLRDLGGMSVSYTVNGVTTTGTIKYGRLYRGAQIASGQTGVNDLKKLGITREIDLRANGDGNSGQSKFESTNYDVSLSDTNYLGCRHFSNQSAYCFANPDTYSTDGYYDVKITNYQVNPVANDYFSNAYSDNFDDLKAAMKAVMRQIVNHENVFFHCTIGTDRTGTIAYFLEGLLGVSEEDRLRDYEMTYFFGLTNRSRFHNNLSTSSINPRFYAMYKSYPTVSDIENFYKTHPESDDDSLLAAFRQEMILQN